MRHSFLKVSGFSVLLIFLSLEVFSQRATRIVVVDSISFEALPAVFVQIKNTRYSFMVNPTGIFTLNVKQTDTLVLSHIGYHTTTIPLFFEEDAIMVRMRPKVTVLDEVVIKSRRLYPNEINPRVSKKPETRTVWNSIHQPWEYFNKREKERRKLAKLMQEHDLIKTFMEVITDPSIKEELMETYSVEEQKYYDILVKFNQSRFPVIYSNDSEKIIEALHAFFEKETQ